MKGDNKSAKCNINPIIFDNCITGEPGTNYLVAKLPGIFEDELDVPVNTGSFLFKDISEVNEMQLYDVMSYHKIEFLNVHAGSIKIGSFKTQRIDIRGVKASLFNS